MKNVITSLLLISNLTSFSPILNHKSNIDELDTYKVFEMNFNDNNIKNEITGKEYKSDKGKEKLVSSYKGNGYEFNDSIIKIPNGDIDFSSEDKVLTVSFLYKPDNVDTNAYPISFGRYNLLLADNKIGFNTCNSDLFGTAFNFEKGKVYSIIAEFNKNDVSKNKIYIDGKSMSLENKAKEFFGKDSSFRADNATFGNGFGIGTISTSDYDLYRVSDKSVIDEINIYKKPLNPEDVNIVSNRYKIPELTVEKSDGDNPCVNLKWATEILPSNILWNEGFEPNEVRPSLCYSQSPVTGNCLGEQSFSQDAKYTGEYGYQLLDNRNGKGNNYLFPWTQSDSSKTTWDRLYNVISKNMNLSLSMRVNTNGSYQNISVAGQGGFEKKLYYWDSYLAEDTKEGDPWLTLTKLDPSWELREDGKTPKYQYKVFPDVLDDDIKQDNYIREIDVKNKRIKLAYPPYRLMKKGEVLKHRHWVNPFYLPTLTSFKTDGWKLVNLNTKVIDNQYYDPMDRGFALIMMNASQGKLFLDDIKLGYATKVNVYRGRSKIYEGYESQFKDKEATDKEAPNQITNFKVDTILNKKTLEREFKISFDEATDNGSDYVYNIEGVSNDGQTTPKSKLSAINIKSGVKGYSYCIDTKPNTEPDNEASLSAKDTSINWFRAKEDDKNTYYLHIKTVDKAGNVSKTQHFLIDNPTLKSEVDTKNNLIKLNWNMKNLNDNLYKVYQLKEGDKDYQTIGNTDIDKNQKVKVLNVYPNDDSYIPKLPSFKTWKGENVENLPISASLKEWMEKPNNENPKGYGKGLIDVTPVDIQDFNNNPNNYLKNSDGTYKYDVIMFGSFDSNSGEDLNEQSYEATKEFIDKGRGVLFGHDTLTQWQNRQFFPKLSNYVDVKTYPFKYEGPSPADWWTMPWSGSNQVQMVKKGLLVNYPWNIYELNRPLQIPYTHTNSQIAKGNVWLKFYNPIENKEQGVPIVKEEQSDNGVGSNMYYLTTNNNTAMIQTGHSGGQATPDEQKILANTLFYLNQLNSNNYLLDHSGQDLKAPDKPSFANLTYGENTINFKWNKVKDNGSMYKYYVEAQSKDGNKKFISNIVSETITTGLKGYSYVIDSNPNTIPDSSVDTYKESIDIPAENNDKDMYIHIKAIDNVGNGSEVLHYKVSDTTKPKLKLSLNNEAFTNKEVIIKAIATDNESGVSKIVLPNGNIVKGSTATFTVDKNGTYQFKAIDKLGNITNQSIVVKNIDKMQPKIEIKVNSKWSNKDEEVSITAND